MFGETIHPQVRLYVYHMIAMQANLNVSTFFGWAMMDRFHFTGVEGRIKRCDI